MWECPEYSSHSPWWEDDDDDGPGGDGDDDGGDDDDDDDDDDDGFDDDGDDDKVQCGSALNIPPTHPLLSCTTDNRLNISHERWALPPLYRIYIPRVRNSRNPPQNGFLFWAIFLSVSLMYSKSLVDISVRKH